MAKKTTPVSLPETIVKNSTTSFHVYGAYLAVDSEGGCQDYTARIPLVGGLRIVSDDVLAKALCEAKEEAEHPLRERIELLEDHILDLADGIESKVRLIESGSPTSKYTDALDVLKATARELAGPSIVKRRLKEPVLQPIEGNFTPTPGTARCEALICLRRNVGRTRQEVEAALLETETRWRQEYKRPVKRMDPNGWLRRYGARFTTDPVKRRP